MKRNRTRLLLIAASLASFLLVGWTLAAWTVSGVADNVISTAGTLGGKIDEIYTEPGEIYPGAVVDKVVNVKNTGNIDLLARVKISYAWGDSRGPAPDRVLNKNNLDTGNIKIQTDTTFWTNGGDGWYYYKGVIAPANTSLKPLFEKFTLDAVSTTDEYRGKTADIKVDLECIQVPGNAAEAVWGKPYSFFGIEEPKAPAGSTASVSFVDPASGFAFDKGIDLFINMKEMYPGETRVQPIEVKNTYTQAAEIFLRADYIGQTGDTARIEKLLKEYATVIITAGGKTIYNGAVWGNYENDPVTGTDSMKNNISLGSFTPNEVKNLSMSLAIDPNMGNEYQALIGHVKWIFTAMGDDQPKPPVTTPDAPTPEDPVIPPTNPDNRYTSETEYPYTDWEQTVLIPNALVPLLGNLVPLTGVTGFTVLWVIGMVASAWIFALLILPIFKRKKENSRNAAQ